MEADRSEPFFNVPTVVLAVIGILVLVQAGRGLLGAGSDVTLVSRLAFIPGRLTFAFDPVGVVKHFTAASSHGDIAARQEAGWANLVFQRGASAPWSLLTYALLHGGWSHLGLNSVWLLTFGTPVARRFGPGRFLLFLTVTAVAGAVAHWVCFPFGFAPVVGASAAISGLMGAAVRFMFQGGTPGSDLRAVAPLRLVAVFRDRRAVMFILVWFATNALFGIGAESMGLSNAPVAWQAHLGGFLAGLAAFAWFDPSAGGGIDHAPDLDPVAPREPD